MAFKNANDVAWTAAFEEYDVLSQIAEKGYADLTANQLRIFREPRHMGKIDHQENLPQVFSNNNLSIMTLSNSAYRVGPYKTFQPLPLWQMPDVDVETLEFPMDIETIDFGNLTGEPGVMNAAHATGMLTNFCGEQVRLTVSGRMRTSEFSYEIETTLGGIENISVNKAQMEIDAGYEGHRNFYLFEVKNHSATNFNMRQLYYPLRTWVPRTQKPVIPILLTHSNDVFDFYQFQFENVQNYSSAQLFLHKRYMLKHGAIYESELVDLARRGLVNGDRGKGPFPQADNIKRVIDLVSILIEKPSSQEDLATHYGFTPRQSHYYFAAAKYLGLADSSAGEDRVQFRYASTLAHSIFSKPYREKYLELAALVLGIDSVAQSYLEWVNLGGRPSKNRVEELFNGSMDSAKITGETVGRRAQTILAWTSWLHSLATRK